MMMNLIIFGPQGCGKGTQAELLSQKYNLAHIETGQIFRQIAQEDSELGRKVNDVINIKKELVSDDLTVEVLQHYVEKVSPSQGVIIDTAPRTLGQVPLVEKMLTELGRELTKAIYITLPYEESVARITKRFACSECKKSLVLGQDISSPADACPFCKGKIMQRTDDTPEGIAKRLKIFYEITVPAIEYYREKGMLIEIDGNQTREEVFEEIVSKL